MSKEDLSGLFVNETSLAITLTTDEQFQKQISSAGSKLVVVNFFAKWCSPCRIIEPLFTQLPKSYPGVVFLQVDIGRCIKTAIMEGVTALPTFGIYRHKECLDSIQGAQFDTLKKKLDMHFAMNKVNFSSRKELKRKASDSVSVLSDATTATTIKKRKR